MDNFDYNQMTFDKLGDADKTADLLNNINGRAIGEMLPNASNTELAKMVIMFFECTGLYTVESKDGKYTVTSTKLTGEQAQNAFRKLQELGNNGLTKLKDEDENKK